MSRITQTGLEKMKADLSKKKEETLPRVTKEYNEAVADGDGEHDNAMFRNKKHELTYLLEEIAKLEETIRTFQVINTSKNEIIQIGSKVKLFDLEQGKEKEVTLVSVEELEYIEGGISIESPLGRELIGRKLSEVVTINLPSGLMKEFRVVQIL